MVGITFMVFITFMGDTAEDEGMAEGPSENMLRKIIKETTPKRKAIPVTPATWGTMLVKKKRLLPPIPTIQKSSIGRQYWCAAQRLSTDQSAAKNHMTGSQPRRHNPKTTWSKGLQVVSPTPTPRECFQLPCTHVLSSRVHAWGFATPGELV